MYPCESVTSLPNDNISNAFPSANSNAESHIKRDAHSLSTKSLTLVNTCKTLLIHITLSILIYYPILPKHRQGLTAACSPHVNALTTERKTPNPSIATPHPR